MRQLFFGKRTIMKEKFHSLILITKFKVAIASSRRRKQTSGLEYGLYCFRSFFFNLAHFISTFIVIIISVCRLFFQFFFCIIRPYFWYLQHYAYQHFSLAKLSKIRFTNYGTFIIISFPRWLCLSQSVKLLNGGKFFCNTRGKSERLSNKRLAFRVTTVNVVVER